MIFNHQEFYFIRHGQTDWNLKNIAMGSQNIPLNQAGVEQAHEAKKLMHGYEFNSIVSSPLERALQTAEILNDGQASRKIQILDELKEACWGEMEGKIMQSYDWLNVWRNGSLINGAEKYTDFKKRVAKGLQKAMMCPEPVLIISHGVVYWAIQEILHLVFQDLPNATPVYHKLSSFSEAHKQWFACNLNNKESYA
jgi:broad specificity phosphatase PhoE